MIEINKLKSFEEDKQNIFQTFLASENDTNLLLTTAKKFLEIKNPEPTLTIKICEKIHKIYEEKEIQNKKINSIIQEEENWKLSISKELQNKHHDYKEELEKIEKNKQFYDFLPTSIKSNVLEYQRKMLDVSMLMVKSAYHIYNDSMIRLKTPKTQQQQQQQDKMDIDSNENEEAIDSKQLENDYLLTFNKVLNQAIKDILPSFSIEIAKFLKEKNLPMICTRVCKELAIKISNERKVERETLKKSDCGDLDQVTYQVIETCIGSIFDTISKLDQKVKLSPHLISDRELSDLTILKNGELLKEFIEFILPDYLQSPEGIIKIGQYLLSINQYNHVVLVAERGRIRLEKLKKEQLEKEQLQQKLQSCTKEIESIEKVSGYSDEKRGELIKLEKEFSVYKMYPTYYSMSKREFSKHNLDIATLRIKSILEMKDATKGILNIQSHLDDTLKTLLDPNHIYQLAVLLQKTEIDTALVYGERCQRFITDLEILREVRLPLTLRIKQLENEETTLRLDGRTISEEKKIELEQLLEKTQSLPEFPFFSELTNRNEYDHLNLQVAQMMITCVLEKKSKLSTSKDQSQKDRINQQVSALIIMCLEKFKDPKYLLELEKHLKLSREDKVVIQIANQIFNRCDEIENQRIERVLLEKKEKETIDELEKSKIIEQIKKLPTFPYYASLTIENQYDDTIYDAAEQLMSFLLDNISFIDEKLRKSKLFNIKNIEDEQLIKDREETEKLVTESLSNCLKFVRSPSLVCKFANALGAKRESLYLEISKHIHPIITEKHKQAMEIKQHQFLIETLNLELSDLSKMKKEMPESDIELLQSTTDRMKTIQFPYLEQWVRSSHYNSQLISNGIQLLLKNKQEYQSPKTSTISKNELTNLIKSNQENFIEQFKLLSQYLEDPKTFTEILTLLRVGNDFENVTEVGKLAFAKLKLFREHQNKVKELNEKKKLLVEERDQLNKQRRRLSTEKHLSLREITISEHLNSLLEPYYIANLDTLALIIGSVLIEANTCERSEFEIKASSKAFENQFKYISEQRKRINDTISQSIKLVVENINSIEDLLKFTNDLYSKKEYLLVLQVGQIIEASLEQKKNTIEHKENLLKEIKELQGKYLHSQNPKDREKIQAFIDQNQQEYDSITLEHTYEVNKDLTIQITKLMIESASIEDQGDILREQLILSFKNTTSPLDWDRIRNISNEEEWAETKKDLVIYIMKREENINSKIELLLKDLLFEEAIQIFPHPSSDNDEELDIQLNLLVSLYDAVDQHAFHLINGVIPIIQRFAKRCYIEWKYEKLDILYDSLQKRFPKEIVSIFTIAIDMMLVNILQSQYPLFLNMMKSMKNRLVATLGLDSLWEDFLAGFRKNYKSKKRLIQMISLIGDSVWQINVNPNSATGKQIAKRTLPQSSQSAHKKIKVSAPTPSLIGTPKKASAKKSVDEDIDEEFLDENEDNENEDNENENEEQEELEATDEE
ncbi:hypothetical protein ACTFIZ_003395 [Dictyostelium cf. discoideum]